MTQTKTSLLLMMTTAFFAASCVHRPSLDNRTATSTYQPPTSPELETIVIVGTNDQHGALAPQVAKSREPNGIQPIEYERGGAAMLASNIHVFQKEWGNRLLLLDAGDIFQGSLDSNREHGAPMVALMNSLGYTASAIGNHEFDFGPVTPENPDVLGNLKARMSESHFRWLAANLIDRKTGELPDFPNTSRSMLVTVGRLQVGVLGLSTLETPTSTRPTYIKDLKFQPLAEAALRESKLLRAQGADIILLTTHAGLFCQDAKEVEARTGPDRLLHSPTDPGSKCRKTDEIVRLLNALPHGTIDAVVSGHTHSIVHAWVNGVPVVQAGTRNLALNAIYLTYDLSQKRLIQEQERIEGPIPICRKIFENQGDCNGDRPAPRAGRGSLVTPQLHGTRLEPDPATLTLLEPVFQRTEKAKRRILGTALRPIEIERRKESPMGNLVTDAMRIETGADVALANPGGLRAPFEEGPISYEELFRTLPFDNSVAVMTVTGKELKMILRVAENGARGYFPVSGVKLRVLDLDSPAHGSDLNHDGKIDLWEIDRLIEARLADGSPIDDHKKYRLATIDFLIQGGDDMGWVFTQIPPDRIQIDAAGMIRDVVERHIIRLQTINSVENPLVLEHEPRIKIEKDYPSTQKSKSRRKRKSHSTHARQSVGNS